MPAAVAVPHTERELVRREHLRRRGPGEPDEQRGQLDQPAPADDGVDPAGEEARDAEQRDDAEARVGHARAQASAAHASTMSSTSSSWWACPSGIAVTSTRCAAGMSECGIQIARIPTCCGPWTSSNTRSPT